METPPNVQVFRDTKALNSAAAELIVGIGAQAINSRGKFIFVLSGGSTPKALYELLSHSYKTRLEWEKAFFFFGDERNVAFDDAESNFRMANESLLQPLRIPDSNVFRWQTELQNPNEIAAQYEKSIRNFFRLEKNHFPRFDLTLLGLGDDGHTASLFPHTEALREQSEIAVSNHVEKLNTNRLTLTFPAINSSENVVFLVSGEKKADVLPKIMHGDFQPERLPAQNIKLADGKLVWLLDEAAAKSI